MRILVDHSGPNGLGDIVMGLPLYDALADRYPRSEIRSRGSRLLALGNPRVAALDESTPADAFDLVVRASWRDVLPNGGSLPWVEAFLTANDLPPTYGPPRAYLFPEEVDAVGLPAAIGDRLVIAFSGDSVADPARRWHLDRYATVLRHLVARYDAIVVELGAGYNAPYLGIGIDRVGRTSIRQAMAFLHRADLFLGNHGGLGHLADAIGTPMLSPWGSSGPPRDHNFNPRSVLISPDLPCKACLYHRNRLPDCRAADPARGVARCTDSIAVDDLIAAAGPMVEGVLAERDVLRNEKRRHLADATRWPRPVEADATVTTVTPATNLFEVVGRFDEGARVLDRPALVAAPEWRGPGSTWPDVVAGYARRAGLGYPFVLWLLAGPDQGLSLLDARDLVGRVLVEAGLAPAVAPPIVLVGGYVSLEQLGRLFRRAKVYLPTGGPGEPSRTEQARRAGCPVLARVP